MTIKLVPVAALPDSLEFLYDMLKQRKPYQNISHKKMPTWEEHVEFVTSEPYQAWYIIVDEEQNVYAGHVYLTKNREVGLFVDDMLAGRGYGRAALYSLQCKHPGRLLANISIKNAESIAFFNNQGFEFLQVTLEREDPICEASL